MLQTAQCLPSGAIATLKSKRSCGEIDDPSLASKIPPIHALAPTLIETGKLNSVDPQAWLTDTRDRIADHKVMRLDELMPWRYAASAA